MSKQCWRHLYDHRYRKRQGRFCKRIYTALYVRGALDSGSQHRGPQCSKEGAAVLKRLFDLRRYGKFEENLARPPVLREFVRITVLFGTPIIFIVMVMSAAWGTSYGLYLDDQMPFTVGIRLRTIRNEYSHFADWLSKLEAFAA